MVRASLGPKVSEVFAALLRAAYTGVDDKWQANVNVTKVQIRDALPRESLLDHYLTLLGKEELLAFCLVVVLRFTWFCFCIKSEQVVFWLLVILLPNSYTNPIV